MSGVVCCKDCKVRRDERAAATLGRAKSSAPLATSPHSEHDERAEREREQDERGQINGVGLD